MRTRGGSAPVSGLSPARLRALSAVLMLAGCRVDPSDLIEPFEPDLDVPWETEQLASLALDPTIAVTTDGVGLMAWGQSDSDGATTSVGVAELIDGQWRVDFIDAPGSVVNEPDLAVVGDEAVLVWEMISDSGTDRDLWLSRYSQGAWSPPVDLTSGNETGALDTRDDSAAGVATLTDGRAVVAFCANDEVHTLIVDSDNVSSPSERVADNCSRPEVSVSEAGVALCNTCLDCDTEIECFSELEGTWQPIASPFGELDLAVFFETATALDSSGGLHLAYAQRGDVFYSVRVPDEPSIEPQYLSTTSEDNAEPHMVIEPLGRPLVVYHGRPTPNLPTEIIVAAGDEPPIDITGDAVLDNARNAEIAIDPTTGFPLVSFASRGAVYAARPLIPAQ